MLFMKKKTKTLFFLSLAFILVACNKSNNQKVIYTIDNIVQLDKNQNINQSIDLLLYYPDDNISNIKWQQTTGEPVKILAATSKVISFTPTKAGEYSFSVTFSLNGGLEETQIKQITVNESNHKLTARLSHAALAGNKVSYRAQLNEDVAPTTVIWKQISGPDVTLTSTNSNGELAIFFDAPTVDNDTIITFKVSAKTVEANKEYHDNVAVLVEAASSIHGNAYFSDRKAKVFPYNNDSPYAENIVACVYSNTLTSSCTLDKTPLIAQEVKNASSPPSVDIIMDRVVVSHLWMGDKFKAFLTNNDPNNDIKNLLRATTAIVIAYDVRPSFYWAATGAIYLDAENLWLTPQERDTINEAPDFRADFGNDLQFVMPWRYVKDNVYASTSYSKSSRSTRTPEDALYRLISLMYHELAHANDFFPSYEWYIHNSNKRVLDAAISSDFESDKLAITYPLHSQEMRDLAQVSFAGEKANQTQINYLPTDIELFFSSDTATDFYAYSSEREDYAMLFEELMMQSRFNIMRDTAITNQPNEASANYIVTWGQRGRIGDSALRDRVRFSASRVLPEFDIIAAMEGVKVPIHMTKGETWYDNLPISPTTSLVNMKAKSRSSNSLPNTLFDSLAMDEFKNKVIPADNLNRYYQKPLPKH